MVFFLDPGKYIEALDGRSPHGEVCCFIADFGMEKGLQPSPRRCIDKGASMFEFRGIETILPTFRNALGCLGDLYSRCMRGNSEAGMPSRLATAD